MNIIYEDNAILVIEKEAGIAVQNASFGKKDLESMIKTYLFEKEGKANPYLGLIHRLDQPVQGLVVFAKNQNSASVLSKQLQDGRMKKYYTAVVCSVPEKKEDMLVHYLKKNGRTNLSEVVTKDTPGAKKAMLHYEVIEEKNGKAKLAIELFTGRHHQIRVQLAAMGMPLWGDQKYNKAAEKGQTVSLCASRLEFIHPVSKKKMSFTCIPHFSLES